MKALAWTWLVIAAVVFLYVLIREFDRRDGWRDVAVVLGILAAVVAFFSVTAVALNVVLR